MPSPGKPDDWLCDDPDSPRSPCILNKEIVKVHLYDGKNGDLWKKAKLLTRSDVWAAAGFGGTDKLDKWKIEELAKLASAFAAHCGKPYTGVKTYGICCSCG